jgi:hypothetical protein
MNALIQSQLARQLVRLKPLLRPFRSIGRWILATAIVFGPILFAHAGIESFESDLAGWESHGGGVITISDAHWKLGSHSLRWDFTPGSSLARVRLQLNGAWQLAGTHHGVRQVDDRTLEVITRDGATREVTLVRRSGTGQTRSFQ